MKITICGSMAFYSEMENLQSQLTALGHEAKIPLLDKEAPAELGGDRKINFGQYIADHGDIDAFPAGHALWGFKAGAIRDHFAKIIWAGAILVANYEKRGIAGYVGGNTLIEIGVAFFLDKPIYILNPVSSELSYKQEIYGMKPVLLKGNLDLIPR